MTLSAAVLTHSNVLYAHSGGCGPLPASQSQARGMDPVVTYFMVCCPTGPQHAELRRCIMRVLIASSCSLWALQLKTGYDATDIRELNTS